MDRKNIIGRIIARLRFERNWTQDTLMARLQCQGVDMSRDMVANMELGRTRITDRQIIGLHRVFRVPLIELFPPEVKELDGHNGNHQQLHPPKTRKRKENGSR